MVSLSSGSRYYLWREPVDMRKSFDGLQGLVTCQMGRDALSGEVFIFMNRRRDQVKMLVWDRVSPRPTPSCPFHLQTLPLRLRLSLPDFQA